MLTVGVQHSSVSTPFSYDIASAARSRRSNLPATGSISITLQGSALGIAAMSALVRMSASSCTASSWISDTSILAFSASGLSSSKQWHLTVGVSVGSSSSVVTYDVITEALHNSTSRNLVGTQRSLLSVVGVGFGDNDFTSAVRFGGSSKTGTAGTASGASAWHATTSIVALSATGRGQSQSIVVTAGSMGVVSSQSKGLSYDSLAINHFGTHNVTNASVLGQNSPSTGSISVTLLGVSFAVNNPTMRARIGVSGCQMTRWESDTRVSVRVASGTSVSYPLPSHRANLCAQGLDP